MLQSGKKLDVDNSGRICLVIIDVQKDFTDFEGYYSKSGKDIEPIRNVLPIIEQLCDSAIKNGVPVCVVSSQYEFGKFGSKKQICVIGTEGAKPSLDFGLNVAHCVKYEVSALSSNSFRDWIDTINPSAVLIAGVTTEKCILSTALDLISLGFIVYIISDGVATNRDRLEMHIAALNEVKKAGGRLIESDKVLKHIKK
jgi:nicotinamidase-related amidase